MPPHQSKVGHAERSGGNVNDSSGQGLSCQVAGQLCYPKYDKLRSRANFIQRSKACAVSLDASSRAEGFPPSFTERQGTIFCGVVVVNVQISLALELEAHS